MNKGKEYLAYQPDSNNGIKLNLLPGNYVVECFDTIDNSVNKISFKWKGGIKEFAKPNHVAEDWILYVKRK